MTEDKKEECCCVMLDRDAYYADLSLNFMKMSAKMIVMERLLEISKLYFDKNNPKTEDLIKEIDKILETDIDETKE